MNAALEKDIKRVANENSLSIKELKDEIAEYVEKGFNEISAWARVKSAHGSDIKGIKDTYTMWPLTISEPRTASWDGETHDLIDVIGIFYGRFSKTSERNAGLLTTSFIDGQVEAAKGLKEGSPVKLKGSFSPSKMKIFVGKDSEIVEGTTKDCPDFTQASKLALEDAVALGDLLKQNADGSYLYNEKELPFSGYVGDIRHTNDGKCILELTDIGADLVTCWLPDGADLGEDYMGAKVFGYGWHKVKDGAPNINAKALLPIDEE